MARKLISALRVVLHADQDADRRWAGRGVGAGQTDNLLRLKPGERGDTLGRIFGQAFLERVKPKRVRRHVRCVVEMPSDDHGHHSQR